VGKDLGIDAFEWLIKTLSVVEQCVHRAANVFWRMALFRGETFARSRAIFLKIVRKRLSLFDGTRLAKMRGIMASISLGVGILFTAGD